MLVSVAYCWASGEIEVAADTEDTELPEGVIVFARGERDVLQARLEARARHAYEAGVLLVPGLPEISSDDDDAVEVLDRWCAWAFGDWPLIHGVRTQPAGRVH